MTSDVRASSATVAADGLVDPERVAIARAEAYPADDLDALADGVFGVLADPNRLRILLALLHAGELCVGDLAATTGMSESATSHALRLLRAHRTVKVRRVGRLAYYSLLDSHVRDLLSVALDHLRHDDD